LLKGCLIVISKTVLVVAGRLGETLSAADVAHAIGRGLVAGGLPEPDLCPIAPSARRAPDVTALLKGLDFDARMHRSRAVVLSEPRLQERTLRGGATFEIATRARQGGVPAYAITGENALNLFDARMLDLQVILEARNVRALTAAGRKLAQIV
jgi:glycerate kinase